MTESQAHVKTSTRKHLSVAVCLAMVLPVCAGILSACASIKFDFRDRNDVPEPAEWFAGMPSSTVDSQLARYYLEDYLWDRRTNPGFDAVIDDIQTNLGTTIRNPVELGFIARNYSPDVAAIALWQLILKDQDNLWIRRSFARELAAVEQIVREKTPGPLVGSDYLLVFVPGWFYKSNPASGADFAETRRTLEASGAIIRFIETGENVPVEINAEVVAAKLRVFAHEYKKIVLISASKGGPETALALTELRATGDSAPIRAWINVGGIMHGTLLADRGVQWPVNWWVKTLFLKDDSFDGLDSITRARSGKRVEKFGIPPDLFVLNFVGIPLSGQVTEPAKFGYDLMRQEGPNDGLSPVLDEIIDQGKTIAELGVDHFYKDPGMDLKAIALSRVVIRILDAAGGGQK